MKYEIGAKIKKYREASGLSQRDLASALGISNTRISNWEQGINRPDADMIGALCIALHVSPSRLLGVRITDNDLTDREYDVIQAYRKKPDLQHAVNVLLDIADDK